MKHEEILDIVTDEDDLSWKSILYELVKTEQMDPWDVDVSLLSNKYIRTIKKMQEMDFRVSGNILLAAALLLKFKSEKLMGSDLDELDRLIASVEEPEIYTDFFSEFSEELFDVAEKVEEEHPKLIPKTPQPRNRKISINELADALQKAMEVKKRKIKRDYPDTEMEIPEKKVDITEVIKDIYTQIKTYFFHKPENDLTFTNLLPSESKEDKIYTFIPLLHLENQRKVQLNQNQHFGEILVKLVKKLKKK